MTKTPHTDSNPPASFLHSSESSERQGQLLFWAGLGLCLLACFLLLLALRAERNAATSYNRPVSVQKPFSIGQTIRMGSASVKVSDVTFGGTQATSTAPAGKQYLVLQLTVQNFSDKPINVMPASDMYVKNSTGQVSYLTPYRLKSPFRAGELPPGEKISGQLSYLVDTNQNAQFYIDSIWSGGVVPIALRK
jgi:hypothetical protein